MNKDIEELLNKFDKVLENYELDKKFGQLSVDSICHLFPNEIQILLSYIKELEQENKQLQNNRNKAIEICDFYNKKYNKDPLGNQKVLFVINNIKDMLKGDSDE